MWMRHPGQQRLYDHAEQSCTPAKYLASFVNFLEEIFIIYPLCDNRCSNTANNSLSGRLYSDPSASFSRKMTTSVPLRLDLSGGGNRCFNGCLRHYPGLLFHTGITLFRWVCFRLALTRCTHSTVGNVGFGDWRVTCEWTEWGTHHRNVLTLTLSHLLFSPHLFLGHTFLFLCFSSPARIRFRRSLEEKKKKNCAALTVHVYVGTSTLMHMYMYIIWPGLRDTWCEVGIFLAQPSCTCTDCDRRSYHILVPNYGCYFPWCIGGF